MSTTPDYGRLWLSRQVMRVLAPLTGTEATATATATALGGDAPMLGGTYAIPYVVGASGVRELDYTRLLKVCQHQLDEQGERTVNDTTVTNAGTSVELISALGGLDNHSLVAGTAVRWDPVPPGIAPDGVLATDFTGGTAGLVKRIYLFDEMGVGRANASQEAWVSRVRVFPSILLSWMQTSSGKRKGLRVRERQHTFRAHVLGSHFGSGELRKNEITAIADTIERLLEDRGAVDGQPFSWPSIELGSTDLVTAGESLYVITVDFKVTSVVEGIDSRTYADWTVASTSLLTPTSPEYPDPADALIVVDFDTQLP